jgi:hypothetical protein
MTMTSSDNLLLKSSSNKSGVVESAAGAGSTSVKGAQRRFRSKSTSASDVSFDAPRFSRNQGNNPNNLLVDYFGTKFDNNNCSDEQFDELTGPDYDFPHDSFNSTIHSADGIFHRFGNPVAGRELLTFDEITSLKQSKRRGAAYLKLSSKNKKARFYEIMNIVILTSVFLLGAFSAVFLTVFYVNNGGNGSGGSGNGERKAMFQPFPQVEQLRVLDEDYLTERIPIGSDTDDEDNECDGENKLGKCHTFRKI